ncbi:MAG: methyltransferase domain-containing protein [Theionarchaea archaeon]|nr:MAG: hypothetical protein AYK18_13175 [Theionarchaea archaeon DG-70]MBU7010191.1 methyltransferase domain-containing protein [Theionarchaea archaeon]
MSEDLYTEEWIDMLENQADYTEKFRHSLYEKVDVKTKKTILDIGCGSGAVTADIASLTDGHVTGIDTDEKNLAQAELIVPDNVTLMKASALDLPFPDNTFDLVVFSVVFLYIEDQQKAVNEMARVTKKEGIVLATAVPDYGGEVSYPESKSHLFYLKHLEDKGVDIYAGRKLKFMFRKAGLQPEVGVSDSSLYFIDLDSEKELQDFLDRFSYAKKFCLRFGLTEEEIEGFKQEDVNLIQNDLRFRFIPAFYAIGRK